MIIRDTFIVEAEQELDELIKFRDTKIMYNYDNNNPIYSQELGSRLLNRTINKKKKRLCELYIDKMVRYLDIKGKKQ